MQKLTYEKFVKLNNKKRKEGIRCYRVECRQNTVYFEGILENYKSVDEVVSNVNNGIYCLINPQKLKRTKYFNNNID